MGGRIGGRQKGTKNKSTIEREQELARLDRLIAHYGRDVNGAEEFRFLRSS